MESALKGMAVVEAANAEEEALAIAVALRQALEIPDKTAALVTPDRALARRVMAALSRWSVPVDDSGGDALADTALGVFARLVAEAALDGLAPVKLLALLKHPLCRVDPWAVAALEGTILRGPRPKAGTEGLQMALLRFREELGKWRRKEPSALHGSDSRTDMKDGEIDAAKALVTQLQNVLRPLETLGGKPQPFAAIARQRRDAMEALLEPKRVDETEARELDAIFDAIADGGRIAVRPADYAEMFQGALADGGVVRPREQDVRVRIYGPLEARLQNVDLMVLGGLTEGVWPPETRADPWLSRPMRKDLGLDLPERRIGLSAHDFVQALGAREVVLTRAARVAGAPTVASRFVQRLAAVAGEARWNAVVASGDQYLNWARRLDRSDVPPRPIIRPEPKPPRDMRPKSLSVTEIETLLRDPYSIYARHVLNLRALDAVDTPLGARDRGTVIHEAVGTFTEKFADDLPDDMIEQLINIGERAFAALQDFPDARAFWWPRFQRIARWLAQFEAERRPRIAKLHAEIRGTLEIPLGGRTFTLRTRADRIEQLADGRFAILDYKTGSVPTASQVKSGLSPQLTLEGAILRGGRFGDIPAGGSIAEIAYVSIRGGEPPGEIKPIAWKDSTPDQEADVALRKLKGVIAKFDDAETPYLSEERPMFCAVSRRLRPSRTRQGMVAVRRRRGRRGGERMNQRAIPPAVIANQHDASDPATSAWVSANAGAGKTHVLAQRVIRLLLERETDPSKILCLTFTKAAAANMANRIFNTLREWIALDDTNLNAAIARTGAKPGGKKQRDRARRLFAAALETPGGLKVQTIHGFCTRLLQQFPFEANVPARFRVLEEVEQQQLLEQLRRTMLFEASGKPDSATGRALAAIITAASDPAFQEGLLEAIRERERLLAWLEHAGGLEAAAAQLAVALGIKPEDRIEDIETAIVDGPHLPLSGWMSAAGVCSSGTPTTSARPSVCKTPLPRLAARALKRIWTCSTPEAGSYAARSSPRASQRSIPSSRAGCRTRKTALPASASSARP